MAHDLNEFVRSIALLPGAELRYLMSDVGRELKARFGSEIHLYCSSAEQQRFYRSINSDGTFDTISRIDLLAPVSRSGQSDQSIIETARQFERRFGTTYNLISISNRHFGRGYALGGFRHPRSRQSEETGYLDMLAAYNNYFSFWEREFADRKFTLVLGGPKEVACVARMHGVPQRCLVGSRYKNFHYWTENEFFENPRIQKRFSELSDVPEDTALTEPYLVERVHRARFERSQGTLGLIRRLAHRAALRTYWTIRGYRKAKGYYASEEFFYIYRQWRDTRKMTGPHMKKLEDLDGQPFIFYPLHTEPETSVGQLSPEYFFQLSAIASLARDLPAGVLLAVKETIHGVGRRPRDFYEQIDEFKNVVILDMMEYGLDVVHKAIATATITGTAGLEAAVIGKPVITFGRRNNYNFLPHVFPILDEAELCGSISRIVGDQIDYSKAKADGARYLQAVVDTSVDLDRYDYTDLRSYDDRLVAVVADALLDSLDGRAQVSTTRVSV